MDLVSNAAGSALQELLDVSPQVDAAVILERDGGRLIASAPTGSGRRSDRLGSLAMKIIAAAEQARTELGREPVSQIEVSTPDGHVFVVADAVHVVASVTAADPTVGLVFYDLKTALRSVREASAGENNGSVVIPVASADQGTSPGDDADDENASATSSSDSSESRDGGRWRRRKS